MHRFIKKRLANDEKMSYLILRGHPKDGKDGKDGKSTFIKKIRIYTRSRNLFNRDLFIDCQKSKNMLSFKINHQK